MKHSIKLKKLSNWFFLTVISMFFAGSVGAAEWWMPRTTLKHDLKIYASQDSESEVLAKASQGQALEEISRNDDFTWILIKTRNNEQGWVFKSSVIKFETDLNDLQNLAFNQIDFYRVGDSFYFHILSWCYVLPVDSIRSQPIGVEHKKSIKQYLDENGGIPPLTQEHYDNCGFGNSVAHAF